jgi:hypothetical protein
VPAAREPARARGAVHEPPARRPGGPAPPAVGAEAARPTGDRVVRAQRHGRADQARPHAVSVRPSLADATPVTGGRAAQAGRRPGGPGSDPRDVHAPTTLRHAPAAPPVPSRAALRLTATGGPRPVRRVRVDPTGRPTPDVQRVRTARPGGRSARARPRVPPLLVDRQPPGGPGRRDRRPTATVVRRDLLSATALTGGRAADVLRRRTARRGLPRTRRAATDVRVVHDRTGTGAGPRAARRRRDARAARLVAAVRAGRPAATVAGPGTAGAPRSRPVPTTLAVRSVASSPGWRSRTTSTRACSTPTSAGSSAR